MGWRDRDYAKWTDEERRRFYGAGPTFTQRDGPRAAIGRGQLRMSGGNRLLRPGAGVAVLATIAIALGQLPLHHPLVPAFHIGPAPAAALDLPPSASVGSSLELHGTAPTGPVTVEGSYDGGQTWTVLSSAQSTGGTYATALQLTQQGTLSIKILFTDGSTATGSILVQ